MRRRSVLTSVCLELTHETALLSPWPSPEQGARLPQPKIRALSKFEFLPESGLCAVFLKPLTQCGVDARLPAGSARAKAREDVGVKAERC